MIPVEVLILAKDKGVHLYLKDEKLAFKANKGALDSELRKLIGEHKTGLIALLQQSSSVSVTIPQRDKDVLVPLTQSQERMLFLQQLTPNTFAYNLSIGMALTGTLDIKHFCDVINQVVSEHSVLNSCVREIDGQFYLHHLTDLQPVIQVNYRDKHSTQTLDETKKSLFEKSYRRVFDLEYGPSVFIDIQVYSEQYALMFFTTHHLFLDGLSFDILSKEIVSQYLDLAQIPAASQSISFEDYAVWLATQQTQSNKDEEYWLTRLADIPPVHSLVLDRERELNVQGKGRFLKPELAPELHIKLKALSKQLDVSLFSLLHTSFSLCIAVWSRQEDIVTGVPVSGRSHGQLENLVGMLANTLVYRAKFDFNESFSNFVLSQHQHHLDAMSHQSVSLERLVELLSPSRDNSHSPLFQILFNLVTLPIEPEQKLPLTFEPVEMDSFELDTKFDLSLNIIEHQQLSFCWDFDQSIFDQTIVEQLHHGLILLLEQMVSAPDTCLRNVSFVAKDNLQPLLAPHSLTFIGQFVKQCQQNPDCIAFTDGQKSWSYQSVYQSAAGLAEVITNETNPAKPIAILGQRSVYFVQAMLACLASGRTYIPIDVSLPPERLATILQQAQVSSVIDCAEELTAHIEGVSVIAAQQASGDLLHVIDDAQKPAYIIFTSGSTGTPKGVTIAQHNLSAFINAMAERIGFESQHSILALTTPSFDISVVELLMPLAFGGSVVMSSVQQSQDSEALCTLIKATQPDVIQATPATWQMLLAEESLSLSKVTVLVGGEALPISIAQKLVEAASIVWNCYGPTEATVWSMVSRVEPSDIDQQKILLDNALCGYDHKVIDQYNNILPVGATGELIIGGAGVGLGYWNNPGLTEGGFCHDIIQGECWYKTGDLVQQQTDGRFRFLGRTDYQVKIRGYRIELTEIEYQLQQHLDDSVQCAVAAQPDGQGFFNLVGYVCEQDCDTRSLEKALGSVLPDYMVPKQWMTLTALPLNSNGKIDRKKLPAAEVRTEVFCEPVNEIERQLQGIWQQLLNKSAISVEDNFFALGGNSLQINKMLHAVKDITGKKLALATVFKAPTIRSLAIELADADDAIDSDVILQRNKDVLVPLTKSQERMLFLQQLTPDTFAYNLCFGIVMKGELDVKKFCDAINRVVSEHSVLNSCVREIEGQFYLHQLADVQPIIQVNYRDKHDTRTLDETKKSLFEKCYRRVFELGHGPSVFTDIQVYSEQYALMFFTTHHLFLDGLSFDILSKEIVSQYLGLAKRTAVSESISFEDYAVWQATQQTQSSKDEEYWLTRLADTPPLHSLVLDREREPHTHGKGRFYNPELAPELHHKLKALANQLDVSLFSLLHTSFSLCIAIWSRQNDIITGVPVSGRSHAQLENVVGMLANTLVYRAKFDFNESFSNSVQSQHQHHLDALSHQSVSLERLVELLSSSRDNSHSPLFQILFNLVTLPIEPKQKLPLTFEPVEIDSFEVDTKFDLSLSIIENQQLSFCWDFDQSIFDQTIVEQLHHGLISLLEQMIISPDTCLRNVSFVPKVKVLPVLAAQPKNFICQFILKCQQNPDCIAFTDGQESWSYQSVYQGVAGLAKVITNETSPTKPIAILGQRSVYFVQAMLACLASGRTYIPLDADMPSERLDNILEQAQVSTVLDCTEDQTVEFEHTSVISVQQAPGDVINVMGAPSAAYIIFTSGSTGTPKGVTIEHHNLSAFINALAQRIGFECHHSILALATPSFDMSVVELLMPLALGGCVVIPSKQQSQDSEALNTLIAETQPDVILATPAKWEMLLAEESLSLRNVTVLVGGEALPLSLARTLINAASVVWNCYGPTETTGCSIAGRVEPVDIAQHKILLDNALSGYYHKVIDQYNNVLPVGAIGELIIGGVGVGLGYWNNPELTASVFCRDIIEGECWYKTGDLVQQQIDGRFRFLGRSDHQVKIRGYRIELTEIEYQLQQYLGESTKCVVSTQPDGQGFLNLVGYICQDIIDTQAVEQALSIVLPDYMVPKQWVTLTELPLNSNGKIERKKLPAAEVRTKVFCEPVNKIERQLQGIWQHLLNKSSISVEDNFFALGGNSLKINKMLHAVKDITGKKLALAAVFKAPTIRSLANALDGADDVVNIRPRPKQERTPLSSSQQRIWLADSMHASSANHIPMALKLTGQLDPSALKKALLSLVHKHDALRTYFDGSQWQAHQCILEASEAMLAFSFSFSESDLIREESDLSLLRLEYRDFISLPFLLSNGPLFRVKLVKLAEDEFALFVVFHHIVFDGWSFGIFLNDMISAYQQVCAGKKPDLKTPEIGYADYAYWQQNWLGFEEASRHAAFWQDYLTDIPLETRLLSDLLPEKTEKVSSSVEANIASDLMENIRATAVALQTNTFNVLYASFNLLVAKLTGQKTVVTGTPVSGRELPEVQDMIGMFVNNLAVKVDIASDITLAQYLTEHMENLANVFEHQALPFESVIDIVNPPRDLDVTPVFQMFFNMLNIPDTDEFVDGLAIKSLFTEDVASKFDLTIYISELEDVTQLLLVYQSDRFSSQRMQEFLDQYWVVLHQIVSDPQSLISEVKLTSDMRLPASLITDVIEDHWDGSITERFNRQVARHQEHDAIIAADLRLSYRDLYSKVNGLSHFIIEQKLLANSVVAIMAERNATTVIAIMAILSAGHAFTLFDMSQGVEKVERQIEAVKPAIIFNINADMVSISLPEETVLHQLPELRAWHWHAEKSPIISVHKHDLACITFTSGSSGEVKAVRGSHTGLASYLSWFIPQYSIGIQDRISMLSGLTHDPLQRDIFEAVCSGATLVIPNENEIKPGTLSNWIHDNGISISHLTPSQSWLLDDASPELKVMRHVFLVGELLSASVVGRLASIFTKAKTHNVYGATETQRSLSFTLCQVGVDPSVINAQSPDTVIKLHESDGDICVMGQQGELVIWSNNISLSYLNNNSSDNNRFIRDEAGNRGYRTGDIGVKLVSGQIKLLGRTDRQVKLRGYRIELAEVETYLESAQGIKQAAVKFEGDAVNGYLSAYIVTDEASFDMTNLKQMLRRKMPIYMIPTHWAILPQLPMNSSGKVSYRELDGARLVGAETIITPQTLTQEKLVTIWLKFLTVAEIGIDHNFFEAGGHSLDAAQMLAQVKNQFSLDISLRQIFDNPTIRELAFLFDSLEAKALLGSTEQDNNNIEVIEL